MTAGGKQHLELSGAILVVSPHFDDGVLSVGGLMQRHPETFAIVTVFGRSASTNGGFAPDEQRAISARRRAEDVAACRHLGVTAVRSLPFADARLRGRSPFSPDESPEPEVAAELERALSSIIDAASPRLVLFPLALGEHLDHMLVAGVGARLAVRGGTSVAFYEDLPYAAFYALDDIDFRAESVAGALGRRLEPLHVPCDDAVLRTKREALACYPSQLRDVDLARVAAHAERRRGEVIHVVRARDDGSPRLADWLAGAG